MREVSEQEVLREIARIASEKLELERPIHPSLDLQKDLQLDSLELTILAVELENGFRVKLTQDDALRLRTAADLARCVVERARERAP